MNTIQPQFRKGLPFVIVAVGVLAAGSVLGVEHELNKTPPPVKIPMAESAVPRPAGPYVSFAPIVKKVEPAVVNVFTTTKSANLSGQEMPDSSDPFWRFFGQPFGPMAPHGQLRRPVEHGIGSGVIVTSNGYILTNNHVVDGATEVKVKMQDGREFTAKVIGHDSRSDLAVIKIDATDLPVVPMADSNKVEVGDIVLAVGDPFGVGQTVTEGIVSATNRSDVGLGDYENFIQTDAAINPGNSGGALVDVQGRLIGINTAILSRSGGFQGIGFAIPSDIAHNVMESLIQYGHVTRGYLGARVQNLTPALANEFKLKQPTGALIGEVVSNGPAKKAGIKDGDVVVAFNGHKIADSRQLQLEVAQTKPGSTVPVKILRDGSAETLEVTVGRLPSSKAIAQASNSSPQDNGTLQGVGVENLGPQVRQQFKIPDNVQGAVISQVAPDSAAADAGLKPGDVIESINRHPVKDADQAVQLTQNSKDKQTLLRIWSDGGSHYVVVDESQAS